MESESDPDFPFIDTIETLVFLFQEVHPFALPYQMEVIWIHDDDEYFFANDANAIGECSENRCSENFIPLVEKAVRKAKKLKSFTVRHNNELDRTWPYTKVSRIAEIVSSVKEGMDVVLDSVDEDCFKYIVNLVPMPSHSTNKRNRQGDKIDKSLSFVDSIDFSHPSNELMMTLTLHHLTTMTQTAQKSNQKKK